MIETQDREKISGLKVNSDDELNNRIDRLFKEFLNFENQKIFKKPQVKIDETLGNN